MYHLQDEDVIERLIRNRQTSMIKLQRGSSSGLQQNEELYFYYQNVRHTCRVTNVRRYGNYEQIPENLKEYVDSPENINLYGGISVNLMMIN